MYEGKGNVLVMGDLNSRTGHKQENWMDIIDTHTLGSDENLDFENIPLSTRLNQDGKCNSYGNLLLDILNDSHMLILNGRTVGDMLGAYTYHGYNGSSNIDLCIASRYVVDDVQYFRVLYNPWYTDHCPIAVNVRTGSYGGKIVYPNCRLYPLPVKFKWDIDGINKYKSLIHNSKNINIFNTINDVLSDPNEGIVKLSDVLLDTANESLITKRVYDHKKHHTLRWPKSSEPAIAKGKFFEARRMFMSNLDNSDKKRDFICAKKFYKNVVSIYRVNDKTKRVNTIANMEGHNAKDFWKQIKFLMGRGRTRNLDIDCNKLTDHFRSLLTETPDYGDAQFREYIRCSLHTIEHNSEASMDMDMAITRDELNKGIINLKKHKSSGIDGITNEMSIYGGEHLYGAILTIFNKILDTSIYPTDWHTKHYCTYI